MAWACLHGKDISCKLQQRYASGFKDQKRLATTAINMTMAWACLHGKDISCKLQQRYVFQGLHIIDASIVVSRLLYIYSC